MSLIPTEQPHFEEMNEVVKLYVQNINPTQIAREMGLRRVDVLAYVEEWKKAAQGTEVMRNRVEDLITSMDEHYSLLIRKAYEIIDEVDELKKSDKETMTRSQMLSQKKGALDLIAKLEKDRIDVLQKAGLLEAADFGDQLAQFEEEKATLKEVLKEHLCSSCSAKVRVALAGRKTEDVVFGS